MIQFLSPTTPAHPPEHRTDDPIITPWTYLFSSTGNIRRWDRCFVTGNRQVSCVFRVWQKEDGIQGGIGNRRYEKTRKDLSHPFTGSPTGYLPKFDGRTGSVGYSLLFLLFLLIFKNSHHLPYYFWRNQNFLSTRDTYGVWDGQTLMCIPTESSTWRSGD